MKLATNDSQKQFVEQICKQRDTASLEKQLSICITLARTTDEPFYTQCYYATINYQLKMLRMRLGDRLVRDVVDFKEMKEHVNLFFGKLCNLQELIPVHIRKDLEAQQKWFLSAINLRESGKKPKNRVTQGKEASMTAIQGDIEMHKEGTVFYLKNKAAAQYIINQGATVSKTEQGGTKIQGTFELSEDIGVKFKKGASL